MIDFPENMEAWLEQAQERLTEVQAERARLDHEHSELVADMVQVRTELARRAFQGVGGEHDTRTD